MKMLVNFFSPSYGCTVVFTVSEIWLEFLGDFGEKTGRYRRENMTEKGPQLICIDLCSNMDQSG